MKIEARENDPPNHVVLADVNVTLLDENDNSPQFKSSRYEGKVFKNQTVGMLVTQVRWFLTLNLNSSLCLLKSFVRAIYNVGNIW